MNAAGLRILAGRTAASRTGIAAPVDVDYIRLSSNTQGNVSYGRQPSAKAQMRWQVWNPGPPKVYRVDDDGVLGATGPNVGRLCARLKIVYMKADGTILKTQVSQANQRVCLPPGNGGNFAGIPVFYYDSSKVRKVKVILQKGPSAGGPWTTVASKTCVLKTTDCP